jgi:hypothetical protein
MGHIENKCWKKGKETKSHSTINNYMEVLVDDEVATLQQLNKLCGTKHEFFFKGRIFKRRLPMEM